MQNEMNQTLKPAGRPISFSALKRAHNFWSPPEGQTFCQKTYFQTYLMCLLEPLHARGNMRSDSVRTAIFEFLLVFLPLLGSCSCTLQDAGWGGLFWKLALCHFPPQHTFWGTKQGRAERRAKPNLPHQPI